MRSPAGITALLAAALLVVAGCQLAPPPTPTATVPPPTPTVDGGHTGLVIATATGRRVDVRVEMALTPDQRARGLMFRERLAEGEGMLFIFPAQTTASFWMDNTKVPLSIAFIAADGAILGLDDMQPLTRVPHAPPGPYRYALEVPQGFFVRQGIKAGDTVLYRAEGEPRPLAELPAGRDAR